jgi:NitT/TauT family transport system ATP-binding protein
LSGGMQQRVGLARALAVNPDILLMDEPFASVDAQTRRGLQDELARIQSTTHKTIVFVTHDIDEAVRLGDRVLLMSPRPGRVRDAITVPKSRPSGEEVEADLFAIKSRLWTELREGA